jgi:thioredoxin-dependent peroxiredoxin
MVRAKRGNIMKTLLIVLLGLFASRAWAIQVGDPAPDVSAPSTSGKGVRISDLKGSWVILYFFPKAFTPGCTAESCSLRDGYSEIQKLGAKILGVSLDNLPTQVDFKAKYHMPFDLLSDSKKEVAKAFDSLGLAGMMTQRKTFIINPEGKIAFIFDKVNTGAHDKEVAGVLKDLQAKAGAQ